MVRMRKGMAEIATNREAPPQAFASALVCAVDHHEIGGLCALDDLHRTVAVCG